MTVQAFITQRRRWGNGALASLLFGVSNTWTTLQSSHSVLFKVANLTVLVLQIISSVLTYFTPALFGFLFAATIRALVTELSPDHAKMSEIVFYCIYGAIYAAFVFVHLKRPKLRDVVVSVKFFLSVAVLNATFMFLVIALIFYEAVVYGTWPIAVAFAAISLTPILIAAVSGDREVR